MIKLLTVEGDPKVPLPHVPVPHPYPAVALSGPGLIYGFTVADPVADVVPDEAVAMVIVNSFAAEVITSKVFVSKSAARYPVPVGGVTDVKVNKSPGSKPCPALFTVTVVDVFVASKVHDVKAVFSGVIS